MNRGNKTYFIIMRCQLTLPIPPFRQRPPFVPCAFWGANQNAVPKPQTFGPTQVET
jgi:hypothetical protein